MDVLAMLRPGAARSWRSTAAAADVDKFYVTCSPGLEEVVAEEVRGPMIGGGNVQPGCAGVSFTGAHSTGYRANLWLRCGVRVLQELASGPLPASSSDPVYQFVKEAADWPKLLVRQQGDGGFRSFAVQSRVRDCVVTSSLQASVRAKDAVCDACRDGCGGRKPRSPSHLGAPPEVPLFLALYRGRALLYRDMSGGSLHKRGYRSVMHKASLNEGVAAAMLTLAGWKEGDREQVVVDPMCGSGTLLIEAALMARNLAPGMARPDSAWPFQTWHDFDAQAWRECVSDARLAEVKAPAGMRLLGNDVHQGALSLCHKDAQAAGVRHLMELSNRDCRDYHPPAHPSLLLVNPPWGDRMLLEDVVGSGGDEELMETWKALGRFIKSQCSDADAYVLSGNAAVTKALHMRAEKKWPITVGGKECRLLHYHVLPPKPL